MAETENSPGRVPPLNIEYPEIEIGITEKESLNIVWSKALLSKEEKKAMNSASWAMFLLGKRSFKSIEGLKFPDFKKEIKTMYQRFYRLGGSVAGYIGLYATNDTMYPGAGPTLSLLAQIGFFALGAVTSAQILDTAILQKGRIQTRQRSYEKAISNMIHAGIEKSRQNVQDMAIYTAEVAEFFTKEAKRKKLDVSEERIERAIGEEIDLMTRTGKGRISPKEQKEENLSRKSIQKIFGEQQFFAVLKSRRDREIEKRARKAREAKKAKEQWIQEPHGHQMRPDGNQRPVVKSFIKKIPVPGTQPKITPRRDDPEQDSGGHGMG